MNPVDRLFQRLRADNAKAFIPFVTAGDPDTATSAALVRELVRRGASLVEIGFPYSDPIADGSVIQASYTRALARGVRLEDVFALVRGLSDVPTPLPTRWRRPRPRRGCRGSAPRRAGRRGRPAAGDTARSAPVNGRGRYARSRARDPAPRASAPDSRRPLGWHRRAAGCPWCLASYWGTRNRTCSCAS